MAPGHGHDHAQANGFAKGFFGGKARGQVAQAALGPALAAGAPSGQFVGGQNFFGEAFAMALKAGADAADVADVGANAVDHGVGALIKVAVSVGGY